MFNYLKYLFYNQKPKSKKIITKNDDYQKYYKHIILLKDLKKFFRFKNSEYLKALLRNKYINENTKNDKLDYKNYKNIIKK
jgi:hypothetical protein